MSQPVLFRLLWMFNTRFGLQLQGPKVFDADPWWWCQGNYWCRWEWHSSNRWTGAVACGAGTYILTARSAVLWFWTLVQDYKTKDVYVALQGFWMDFVIFCRCGSTEVWRDGKRNCDFFPNGISTDFLPIEPTVEFWPGYFDFWTRCWARSVWPWLIFCFCCCKYFSKFWPVTCCKQPLVFPHA